jgi:two-component system nitrogen regulation response regulator GlnG
MSAAADTVWVVDDDQSIRWVIEKALAKENVPVRSFDSARSVIESLTEDVPAVLVSDVRMPGTNGFALLEHVKREHPELPVIVMTAFSDLDSAVSAFQGGAFEYLPKPFDITKAVELIRRALDEHKREVAAAEPAVATPEMLGQAPAMQDVFRAIGRLSQSHVTVLLTGESGTGKELVARALHRHSPRANKPFVAINTAAIPKDLLESELFGHERGAFTGAQTMRRGRFEQAEEGTLFLDEIGDMPMDLQTRLLRVLSDGHFYRVGGHAPIKANVRVIAATHQNLEDRVRLGQFREDLFHRLNVIRLRLPALRERSEDIALLARYFLAKSARELGVDAKRFSDDTLRFLSGLPFPGNVRQLENLCHWVTVMAPSQGVEVKDLPDDLRQQIAAAPAVSAQAAVPSPASGSVSTATADAAVMGSSLPVPAAGLAPLAAAPGVISAPGTWQAQLEAVVRERLVQGLPDVMPKLAEDFERTVIQTALVVTGGRRVEAAQRLGIGRNTITRKIAELGIDDGPGADEHAA